MDKMPGHISVSKHLVYQINPDAMHKVIEKIYAWSKTVPSGTYAKPVDVMWFDGKYPNVPVDIWEDPFLPGNPGVEGVCLEKTHGPLAKWSLGMPHYFYKQ